MLTFISTILFHGRKVAPQKNIILRLLCGPCNQKRGAEFEAEYLIESARDHVIDPVDSSFVKMVIGFMVGAQEWRQVHGQSPSAKDICKIVGVRKVTRAEEIFAQLLADLEAFFGGKPPDELTVPVFHALKQRWGYEDGTVHRLRDVVTSDALLSALLRAEQDLIRRLGWPVRNSPADNRKWEKT